MDNKTIATIALVGTLAFGGGMLVDNATVDTTPTEEAPIVDMPKEELPKEEAPIADKQEVPKEKTAEEVAVEREVARVQKVADDRRLKGIPTPKERTDLLDLKARIQAGEQVRYRGSGALVKPEDIDKLVN